MCSIEKYEIYIVLCSTHVSNALSKVTYMIVFSKSQHFITFFDRIIKMFWNYLVKPNLGDIMHEEEYHAQ